MRISRLHKNSIRHWMRVALLVMGAVAVAFIVLLVVSMSFVVVTHAIENTIAG